MPANAAEIRTESNSRQKRKNCAKAIEGLGSSFIPGYEDRADENTGSENNQNLPRSRAPPYLPLSFRVIESLLLQPLAQFPQGEDSAIYHVA